MFDGIGYWSIARDYNFFHLYHCTGLTAIFACLIDKIREMRSVEDGGRYWYFECYGLRLDHGEKSEVS